MKNLQSAQAVASSARVSWSWEGLDLPKKATLIRVRWPFTIVCSYLLLYSQNVSIDPAALQGFVLIYLFSNLALYFVEERFFESFYFFAPLIAFDTLFLTATLAVNGKASSEFYVVCFATIFLCCICRDLLGKHRATLRRVISSIPTGCPVLWRRLNLNGPLVRSHSLFVVRGRFASGSTMVLCWCRHSFSRLSNIRQPPSQDQRIPKAQFLRLVTLGCSFVASSERSRRTRFSMSVVICLKKLNEQIPAMNVVSSRQAAL